MQDISTPDQPTSPYPIIDRLLRHRQNAVLIATVLAALFFVWLAVRTGFPEFYAVAAAAAWVTHLLVRLAIELIALVAETLMPR